MTVPEREKRDLAAAGAWVLLGFVLLAFTAFLGVKAAVRFGVLGEGGYIIASSCVEMDAGRGGTYIECEGSLVDGDGVTRDQLAKVRTHSAAEGDTIAVHRAPWGTYEELNDSVIAKAQRGLVFMLLAAAVVGCFLRTCTLLRRKVRGQGRDH